MKRLNVAPSFIRNWRKLERKRYDKQKLDEVVNTLRSSDYIPRKYHDHALSGDLKGYRECHIERNWLLVYETTETEIILVATGTHDDLFK